MSSRYWYEDALCAGTDPDGWDADVASRAQLSANLRLCRGCPVRVACAQDALAMTNRTDQSNMIRAGMICDRRTRTHRERTELELVDLLGRLGVTVKVAE